MTNTINPVCECGHERHRHNQDRMLGQWFTECRACECKEFRVVS